MILKLTTHLYRGGQKCKKGFALPAFIALIFTALIFISCNNLFEEPVNQKNTESPAEAAKETEKKYISISGSMSIDGALPAEYAQLYQIGGDSSTARTAFPSIPSTGLTYTVIAENTASDSESYVATVTTSESGTNYVVAIPAPVPTSETPNPTKTFKITASVKQGDNQLFYGESEAFTISYSSPVAGEAVNVSVHAKQTGNYLPAGTGNASLEVGISGSGVTKGKLSIDNGAASDFEADSNKIVFTSSGLNSGVHTAKFDFINDDNLVLYSFTEVINIFDNLTTNTWVQNGNEPWFNTTTAANGTKTTTCQVTAAMVEGFTRTEIWVNKNAANDNGSGSFFNPKKTLDGALAMLHDAGKDYTIYIMGEINGTCTIPNTLKKTGSGGTDTYARSLTICGYTGLSEGVPQDSINGGYTENNNGHTLRILTEVPVIIKNLKITGGYSASNVTGGGGIFSTGDLTLDSGALVTGNYSKSCGGGVYNDGGILRIKSGAVISDNHEVAAVDNCGGGGVFNNNGTLIMSGGTIKANTAAHNGGGIYNTITNGDKLCVAYIYGDAVIGGDAAEDGNKALGTSSDGGGIYNKGGLVYFGYSGYVDTGNPENPNYYQPDTSKLVAWTGKISHNSAGGAGGGFYTTPSSTVTGQKGNGIIYMNSGKISANTADNAGGILINNGSRFTLNGGLIGGETAEEGNSATTTGGGVVVMGRFTINGGTISYNTANAGGGVFAGSDLIMTGGVIKNNSATDQGGAIWNQNHLRLNGSAYIPVGDDGKNDVYMYLSDTCDVTLTGALTPPEECNDGILAKITPSNYSEGNEILKLADSATTSISAEFTKFDVIQPDATSHYLINYLGKLQSTYGSKATPSAVYDIVFNDGSAEAYSESLVLSKKQKDNAIAVIYVIETGLNDAGVTGERMLGVGLVQTRLAWCTTSAKANNEHISGIAYNADNNGSTNLSQIATALGDNNDTGIGSNSTATVEQAAALYPAFYFGINYKNQSRSHNDDVYTSNVAGTAFEDGWYLPAYWELEILVHRTPALTAQINTIMNLIHGMPFEENFVDGEEYGWWTSSGHNEEGNKKNALFLVYRDGSVQGSYTEKERGFITCAVRQFN